MPHTIIFTNTSASNSGIRFNVMLGSVGLLWYSEDSRGELAL